MKKILFPTDFSKNSENAFLYALSIADKFGASITTIHTYNAPAVVTTPLIMVEEMIEMTEKVEMDELQAFYNRQQELAQEYGFGSVKLEEMLECGLAVEEIIRISEEQDFDLIVMSTAGAEGLGRWLFGSHAASVVERSKKPVLVIPKEAKYQEVKKIAYATNFDKLDEQTVGNVLQWVNKFSAELFFVHVSSRGEYIDGNQYEQMKALNDLAEMYENVRFKVLYDAEVLDELEDFVEDEKVDMLVMLSHRYPFYQRIFKPSFTKQMTFETEVPLLVFYAND